MPRDINAIQLGYNIRLKDVDVEFNSGQFAKAYFWHLMYFMILGPMTSILQIIFCNYALAKNMIFLPSKSPLQIGSFVVQTMQWVMFIIPVMLLLYKKITDGQTWIELHEGDYDLVVLLFTIL